MKYFRKIKIKKVTQKNYYLKFKGKIHSPSIIICQWLVI